MPTPDPAQYAIVIAKPHLFAVVIVLLVVAIILYASAAVIRWKYNRLKEREFAFMLGGFLFYIAYEAILLRAIPVAYRLSYVQDGLAPVYPTIFQDALAYIKLMSTLSVLFWCLLWGVKLSLLMLYRRLMIGLPLQLRAWMVVFVYTIIMFLFCIISTMLSCGGINNVKDQMTYACLRPKDNLTRNISFYGGFAADVSTDLLIMILPLRLLWGLRMSLRRKLAVGGLFSIAILCTITSVIRLIQINQRTKNTVPNGLWIILWGSLEASTAIIVGSLTSFRFIRKSSGSSGGAYNTTGQSQWPSARKFHSIQMQSYGQESHGPVTTVCHGAETSSSRESLAPKHAVMVTRQHQVRTERVMPV